MKIFEIGNELLSQQQKDQYGEMIIKDIARTYFKPLGYTLIKEEDLKALKNNKPERYKPSKKTTKKTTTKKKTTKKKKKSEENDARNSPVEVFDIKFQSFRAFCSRFGLNYSTAYNHWKKGKSLEEIVPVDMRPDDFTPELEETNVVTRIRQKA